VVVAGDYRFLTEEFMQLTPRSSRAMESLPSCAGGHSHPTVSYELIRRKTAGSINFTASHKFGHLPGLKFNGSDGGPAPVQVTLSLESLAESIAAQGGKVPELNFSEAESKGLVLPLIPNRLTSSGSANWFSLKPFERPPEDRGRFDAWQRVGLHGDSASGGGSQREGDAQYPRPLLRGAGHHPEPGEEELKEAINLVKTLPAHLGLANDGTRTASALLTRMALS